MALSFFFFSLGARMISAPDAAANWPEWQRKIVIYRFDSLMLGVIASWLSLRYPNAWRRSATVAAVLGLVALTLLYASLWKVAGHSVAQNADSYFARTFRFTLVSFGFALLLPLASIWHLPRENRFNIVVRAIALWSYALYLVHTPVIRLIEHFSPATLLTSAGGSLLLFVAETVSAVTISALLYRFYESRCTQLRERVVPHVNPESDRGFR